MVCVCASEQSDVTFIVQMTDSQDKRRDDRRAGEGEKSMGGSASGGARGGGVLWGWEGSSKGTRLLAASEDAEDSACHEG